MSDPIVPGFYAVGDAATFPVAHDGQVFEVVHGGLGAVLTRTGLHDTRRDAEAVA